jgi:uncharacterized protein involved in propanediol utilization
MTTMTTGLPTTAPASTGSVGVGRAFGTFGELVQGVLPPEGSNFLVTLPIARWSVAVFRSEPDLPLRILPGGRTKARRLVELMCRHYGFPSGGTLALSSDLPTGKGYASSSADLVATARAVGDAFAIDPSPAAIEDLLRQIEPTDGVMYDGMVAFAHREVKLRNALGSPPPLTIVGVDEGGTVDTIAFNAIPKPFGIDEMYEYEHILATVTRAMTTGDAETLGAMATRSAQLNQQLRPKRLLDPLERLAKDCGALGVAVAHSGTTLGVLLADDDPDHAEKLARVLTGCRASGLPVAVDHTLSFTSN